MAAALRVWPLVRALVSLGCGKGEVKRISFRSQTKRNQEVRTNYYSVFIAQNVKGNTSTGWLFISKRERALGVRTDETTERNLKHGELLAKAR